MAPILYDTEPQPGDLIEIFRGLYQHWAVYIGKGYVIHLAPPCEVAGAGASSFMSVTCDKAIVKRERLWDVVGTDKWQINNILDDKREPRRAPVIVEEAKALVGSVQPYSLRCQNCEHFATELRYGKAESRQVRGAQNMLIAAGTAAVVGLGAAAFIRHLSGRSKHTEEDSDSD
ncbi:phospholipase A and acyltransferase 3-like [Solea solea]|uniref:phospholipase A and acyltransferase 3-like n=1 Tax=Solea solea TaxID=90069 RepID=UPI00272BB3A5|nr:phospholipase A and acyltransferase 3-like [Solea solea]XP_058505201.1 phospholipase A and acyltransferase 3-like [Solea solea]